MELKWAKNVRLEMLSDLKILADLLAEYCPMLETVFCIQPGVSSCPTMTVSQFCPNLDSSTQPGDEAMYCVDGAHE